MSSQSLQRSVWFLGIGTLHVIALLLLAFSLLLPTGSIYGTNFKLIVAILAIGLLVVTALFESSLNAKVVVAWLCLALFLIGYALIGLMHGTHVVDVISQATAILSTVSILVLVDYLIRYGPSRDMPAHLIRFCVRVAGVLALTKIGLQIAMLLGVISITQYIDWLENVFSYGYLITLETDLFSRLHLPSDYILPVALVYVLYRRYFSFSNGQPLIGALEAAFWITAILIAVLLAYSRLLWGICGALLLTWILTGAPGQGRRDRSPTASLRLGLGLAIVVGALLALIPFDDLGTFVVERFTGQAARSSDAERQKMLRELWHQLSLHPLLGLGLGGHPPTYIRFDHLKWNYELQWLALTMQFGLVGIAMVLGALFALYRGALRWSTIIETPLLPLALFAWLATALVNCFMLTSAGGAIFGALLAGSRYFEQSKQPSAKPA